MFGDVEGAGGVSEGAEAASAPSAVAESTDDVEDLGFIDSFDCIAAVRKMKENPLVAGLLDKGALSALYGPSNVGKSFVYASLAFAVASMLEWAGRPVANGAVLYIAYEGKRNFPRRFAALHKYHKCDAPILLRLLTPPKSSIYSPGAQKAILKAIRNAEMDFRQPIVLVIVDTLAAMRAGGGKVENDNDDMAEVTRIMRKIADETGTHASIIHHMGKDSKRGLRGGSALEGDLDTILFLEKGILSNPKQRDMEKAPEMIVRWKTFLSSRESARRLRRSRSSVFSEPRIPRRLRALRRNGPLWQRLSLAPK